MEGIRGSSVEQLGSGEGGGGRLQGGSSHQGGLGHGEGGDAAGSREEKID